MLTPSPDDDDSAWLDSERLGLSSLLFAITAIYDVNSKVRPSPLSWLLLVAAIALLFRPRNTALLASFFVAQAAHTFALMPAVRNHDFLLALLAAGFVPVLVRVRSPSVAFQRMAPLTRWAAIVIYGFTAFSKLNRDYFSANVSCAGDVYEAFVRKQLTFLPHAEGRGVVVLAVVVVRARGARPIVSHVRAHTRGHARRASRVPCALGFPHGQHQHQHVRAARAVSS